MGNSEVGHNAIGCGRVFAQGAKLVSTSIETGAMFEGQTWKKLVSNVKNSGGKLHFIGLFSDGNVHSHIDHLKAMLEKAKDEGKTARIHTSSTAATLAKQVRSSISTPSKTIFPNSTQAASISVLPPAVDACSSPWIVITPTGPW